MELNGVSGRDIRRGIVRRGVFLCTCIGVILKIDLISLEPSHINFNVFISFTHSSVV